MNHEARTPDRIIALGHAFQAAKALLSAAELGVFTALSEGPLDAQALTTRIKIHLRGARDFFDVLVTLGLLRRDADGRYGNSPEAALFLDRAKPSYVGGMLESLNTRHYGIWASLTTALRTGLPQSGARGTGNYPSLYADPAACEIFVSAMTARSRPAAEALAMKFPWAAYSTIIDIGTAAGCLPVEIALRHPHITGGGFDLPHVKPLFDLHVQRHALSSRLRFLSGDFLDGPLPTADVLILGRVLHNWDLPTKKMLLKKARAALPPHGALIVYERLIDDARCVKTAALLSSLNMLLMSAGGFDFTGADCTEWMQECGFRDIHVEPLTTDQSMVVGTR